MADLRGKSSVIHKTIIITNYEETHSADEYWGDIFFTAPLNFPKEKFVNGIVKISHISSYTTGLYQQDVFGYIEFRNDNTIIKDYSSFDASQIKQDFSLSIPDSDSNQYIGTSFEGQVTGETQEEWGTDYYDCGVKIIITLEADFI